MVVGGKGKDVEEQYLSKRIEERKEKGSVRIDELRVEREGVRVDRGGTV